MIIITGEHSSAVVYSDIISDTANEQILQICNHPMFASSVIRIMPDCHAGKGCVIGLTSVSSDKIVIPNLVGTDIGCGVMTTIFESGEIIDFSRLDRYIRSEVPGGNNIRTAPHPQVKDIDLLWENVMHICKIIQKEELADHFINSIGTLGGGNHFIEIDHITDNRYMLSVHTGSRSLGTHICKFFQSKASVIDERMKNVLIHKHNTAKNAEEHRRITCEIENLPKVSREQAYISDELFDAYIDCMLRAKDYAEENRRCISDAIIEHLICENNITVIERFDTVHNYADWYDNEHTAIIIRKGAVAAENGQRLCIPLNMRDGIIVGTGKGNADWNRSAPHGAGRLLSRSAAKHGITMTEYISAMSGVNTWSVNENTIDEAPQAYKPSEDIIKRIADTVEIDFIARTIYNFKT